MSWIFQPILATSAELLSGSAPPPGTTGQIKVWTGAAWEAKPVKVWNGSTWVTKPVKYWNGSTWVTTPY